MNQNFFKKSEGERMGMPRKGWRISKSLSRVSMVSALPSIAKFKNLLSDESRQLFTSEIISTYSPWRIKNSSIETLSSTEKKRSNLGFESVVSSSSSVLKASNGMHSLTALVKAYREAPSFFSKALTITPVSITTRNNYEISSSSLSISSLLIPLNKTFLSACSKIFSIVFGAAWAMKAANRAALALRLSDNPSKIRAIWSGISRLIVFIVLKLENNSELQLKSFVSSSSIKSYTKDNNKSYG